MNVILIKALMFACDFINNKNFVRKFSTEIEQRIKK